MSRWLGFLITVVLLASSGLGCGEPKKDPALQDKDKPKPAEKNE